MAIEECARHEAAFVEHAVLATQAARAAARLRWWDRFRAGSLAAGQRTLDELKQSDAVHAAEEALRAARARRLVEMSGIQIDEGGGASVVAMTREAADGALTTPAACAAPVRIS